jgi:hypothetical protein
VNPFSGRFNRRGITPDQPSPTLSTEFQIDLSEGPVFGFRGARIEVLEAANSSLKYRVISPFPERER